MQLTKRVILKIIEITGRLWVFEIIYFAAIERLIRRNAPSNPVERNLWASWESQPNPLLREVDLVYLWVDDSDSDWSSRRDEAVRLSGGSNSERSMFQNHDEILFSLISARKNSDWIRKVFIVTDGQSELLRDRISKDLPFEVEFVDHSKFMPKEYLPTFNSHSITANLFRIQELSEYFILMNDDVFFGRKTRLHNWYTPDGILGLALTRTKIPKNNTVVAQARHNTVRVLDAKGYASFKTILQHSPLPMSKTLWRFCWLEFGHELDSSSKHPFRHPEDVVPEMLMYNFGHAKGLVKIVRRAFGYAQMKETSAVGVLLLLLSQSRSLPSFCLNDAHSSSEISQARAAWRYKRVLNLAVF
jgi:hypothetical protein